MTIARKTVADADADVFAALAHPIRRQLLDQLAGGWRSDLLARRLPALLARLAAR